LHANARQADEEEAERAGHTDRQCAGQGTKGSVREPRRPREPLRPRPAHYLL
jgi:hypothetical protein